MSMGIYIKGMEMPDCCDYCPLFDDEYQSPFWCSALNKPLDIDLYEKYPDCPLIEVPPHGRLVDADELIQEVDNYSFRHDQEVPRYLTYEDFCDAVINDLDDAPTVIPADKDGET